MSEGIRAPLIVLELVVLGAVLALVDDPVSRVALGLMVGLLLAYAALTPGAAPELYEKPAGYDDRRHDHLFRHWVNVLLKKIREFHTVCEGVENGGVNIAVGQIRMKEIEREIGDLVSQVTDRAKPVPVRKGARRSDETRRPRTVRSEGTQRESAPTL